MLVRNSIRQLLHLRCSMSLACGVHSEVQSPLSSTNVTTATALDADDYFSVKGLVNMNELFDNRVHFGHKANVRHEAMAPYLFGSRFDLDIIDLNQTKVMLQEALNAIAHIAYRNGIILFLTRHRQSVTLVERTAELCGEYSYCRNWKEGTFTNSTNMFGAEIRLPDACVFLSGHDSVFRMHSAIYECAKMNILTTGIMDTSCDPRPITYPVPGNDDTIHAIQLYCRLFKSAILTAKERRKKDIEEGIIEK